MAESASIHRDLAYAHYTVRDSYVHGVDTHVHELVAVEYPTRDARTWLFTCRCGAHWTGVETEQAS